MPKPWYSIKAAVEGGDVAEVSILDYIGGWGVDAKNFLAEFRAIKANKVKLYINSPGGSVFEALAMFNGMRATGKEIEVHILGVAASAASYIAMAGDRIVMPDNTFMFVHNPINAVYGNAEDMREMADILDKIGTSLTATYSRRWKGTEEELAAALANESYLTAAECLERGFCDEVTPAITAEAAFDVADLPEQLQAVFKAAAARTEPDPQPQPAPAAAGVTMADFERIAAEAGVSEHLQALALDNTLTTLAAVQARATEVREIAALCKLTNREADVAIHVRARKSLGDVRAQLADAVAQEADATYVDTTLKTTPTPAASTGFGPAAFWNGKNTMESKK